MVGKSDFNENPVVSLDLDFGLRLKVCQNLETRKRYPRKAKMVSKNYIDLNRPQFSIA